MSTPSVFRLRGGIIILIIVTGNLGVKSAGYVALVLKAESLSVVLAMTCHVKETSLLGGNDVDSRLLGLSKDVKLTCSLDVLTSYLGMS